MLAYKIKRQQTLFEVTLFPGEFVDSIDHVERLEKRMMGAKHSLYVAMYVLSHARLANAIKAAAKRGVSVILLVDHTHKFCNGSKVDGTMNNDNDEGKCCVDVYVNNTLSHMYNHKYVIIGNEVAIHCYVNFTGHAMTSAGVLVINDDNRLVQLLLEDFAQVLHPTDFRPVKNSELVKNGPCGQCLQAKRNEGDECLAVDSVEASPEEIVRRYFSKFSIVEQVNLVAAMKTDPGRKTMPEKCL